MAIEISQLNIDDYEEVFSLWKQTEFLCLHKYHDSREAIAQYLRRNPGLSLVARDEGAIIGAVLCGHDGRCGHLYHLSVARPYRKNGLAKVLVNQALTKLSAAGISRCTICALCENHSGRRFWVRIGFKGRPDLRLMAIDIC